MSLILLQDATIIQANKIVLSEVDLSVEPGEFVYLIGRTGSGKTSLLKTLYAQLPLGGGMGVVAGFDLRQMNRKNIPLLRRALGMVFQDFNLLTDRNVHDNLDFVLRATGQTDKQRNEARVREVLEAVQLPDAAFKMPYALSGGEQQRVVLARALLNQPKLFVADEPTGNLDPETADDILLLLRQLARDRNAAVVFATHDYRLLEQHPGRIVRVGRGTVYEEVI